MYFKDGKQGGKYPKQSGWEPEGYGGLASSASSTSVRSSSSSSQ